MYDILGYVMVLGQSPVGLALAAIVILVGFFIYRWATREPKPKQEVGSETKEKTT
jgi:hypothetical protein